MLSFLKYTLGWHDFYVMIGTFTGCLVLRFIGKWLPAVYGGVSRLQAVQAVHVSPTPRVGGVAIFLSFVLAALLTFGDITLNVVLLFAATSVLFFAGLLEDIGISVSPQRRLVAATLASLIVIFWGGLSLQRLDFGPADRLLAIDALSVAFTIFITVGGANAFNLIDGLNGLASFAAVITALSLGTIALNAGVLDLAHLNLIFASSIGGFLVLNFPFGKIFLGDAGAYTIGFLLSWVGVALVDWAPDVSPWAVLLALFWPLSETLFTIVRRLSSRRSTMRPDRMHFHHVVLRSLEICVLGRRKRHLANPLATLLMLPFILAPAMIGVMLWNDSWTAFWSVLAFCAAYGASYKMLVRVACRHRRRLSAGLDRRLGQYMLDVGR